jgi:hypothetical protein
MEKEKEGRERRDGPAAPFNQGHLRQASARRDIDDFFFILNYGTFP